MFKKVYDYFYNYNKNEKPTKPEFTLSPDQKQQLMNSEDKPKVVALYDKAGGTTYCDMTANHLKQKGIEVIPVTPQEGLNHPVFKGKIDGIFLPGGPNVPVHAQNDPRKNFEGQLLNNAEENGIPVLGICRGEQTIGHHNGYQVKDIPEDAQQRQFHYEHFDEVFNETQDANYNNKVVVGKGSQLYNALAYKLKHKNGSDIEYNTTCLHQQHVEESQDNSNLQVTGRGKFDGMVESVEKKNKNGKYYTMGLQHHPEAVITACEEARKEKLTELDKQAEQQRRETHFTDCGSALSDLLEDARERRKANTQSSNEIAARTELGFFANQVKLNFLDRTPQKERLQNPGFDFMNFDY